MREPSTVPGVLVWLVRHPCQALLLRWNYKSALLSAIIRSILFFAVNLPAGVDAATGAMLTEAVFRACTSGFYGAVTQAFRRAEPQWAATVCALILLPLLSHSLELAVHWWRGTPALVASIAASIALTVFSTAFNLFAMRRGALVVGIAGRTLAEDLRALPRLIVLFATSLVRSCVRV